MLVQPTHQRGYGEHVPTESFERLARLSDLRRPLEPPWFVFPEHKKCGPWTGYNQIWWWLQSHSARERSGERGGPTWGLILCSYGLYL